MERARVLCPSISLAAHLTFAAILAAATLVVPGRLPKAAHAGFEPLPIDPTLAVSLGGGGLRGSAHARAHAVAAQARVRVPTLLPSLPTLPTLDPGVGSGIDGLDPVEGTGVGFCLVGCGPGPADGPDTGGTRLPALEPVEHRAPMRPGGDIRPPQKLVHVAPVYPPLAVAAHLEGRVVLDCVIDEDGRVSSVTVLRSQPLLEAAAVEAVRQWRYRPTLLNGVRVSVLLTVTVDFRLR